MEDMGLIFQCHIFLPSHTVDGILSERIQEWSATSSSSGQCFIRTVRYDPVCVVALHDMAHSFTELYKSHCHNKAVIHEGNFKKYPYIFLCVI